MYIKNAHLWRFYVSRNPTHTKADKADKLAKQFVYSDTQQNYPKRKLLVT